MSSDSAADQPESTQPQTEDEDRYEVLELIVKTRTREDGQTWFDIIHDFITQDCDSVELEDGEWSACSCGMESMGGMTGTLDQCFAWSTNVGQGLQPIDLARTLIFLANPDSAPYVVPAERAKILDWAQKEVDFEKYFENREWEDDEDEGEDFRELTIDQEEG